MLKFFLFGPFLLMIISCSTLGEISTPGETPFGYHKKNDSSGKYVRQRVIRPQPFASDSPTDHQNDHDSRANLWLPSSQKKEPVLLSTVSSDNAGDSALKGRLGISTSVADEEDAVHFGFEGEVDFYDWLTGRLGFSIFSSDLLYWGGTLGVRASVPHWRVSPYVGVEGYLGDHKSCQYETLNNNDIVETCEKAFLATSYLEMGAMLRLFQNSRIYVFSRGYSKIDQSVREELIMFHGASFFFSF